MTYSVTKCDTFQERQDIIALWTRHLPLLPYPERNLDWGYRDSPFGAGPVWKLMCDGRTVGVAGLVIRQFSVDGTTVLAGRLGGFAVDQEHRSLGPALMLQRAVLDEVGQNGLAAIYTSSPAHLVRMTARAGYQPVVDLTRYVKVLDFEPVLRHHVPSAAAARWMARLLTLTQHVRSRLGWRPCVAAEVDRFDERFDDLWARAAPRYGVTTARTSRFLQWRFCDYPLDLTFVTVGVTDPADGRLRGYAIYFMEDGVAHLADLFAEDAEAALDDVLWGVTRWIRARGAASISVRCAGAGALIAVLRRWGFHPRPDDSVTTIMVSPAADGQPALASVPPSRWHFLAADDFWH